MATLVSPSQFARSPAMSTQVSPMAFAPLARPSMHEASDEATLSSTMLDDDLSASAREATRAVELMDAPSFVPDATRDETRAVSLPDLGDDAPPRAAIPASTLLPSRALADDVMATLRAPPRTTRRATAYVDDANFFATPLPGPAVEPAAAIEALTGAPAAQWSHGPASMPPSMPPPAPPSHPPTGTIPWNASPAATQPLWAPPAAPPAAPVAATPSSSAARMWGLVIAALVAALALLVTLAALLHTR